LSSENRDRREREIVDGSAEFLYKTGPGSKLGNIAVR
jgi:hypothetical protein